MYSFSFQTICVGLFQTICLYFFYCRPPRKAIISACESVSLVQHTKKLEPLRGSLSLEPNIANATSGLQHSIVLKLTTHGREGRGGEGSWRKGAVPGDGRRRGAYGRTSHVASRGNGIMTGNSQVEFGMYGCIIIYEGNTEEHTIQW